MRQNASTNEFARRMTERPIAPSLTAPFHNDPPSRIGYAMGGREWFFETDARALYRIGIFRGLGWRFPRYLQRPDAIDMVQIWTDKALGIGTEEALTIEFLHCGDRPPEEAEQLRVINHIPYRSLKQVYEEALG